jgi:hypothetical protein
LKNRTRAARGLTVAFLAAVAVAARAEVPPRPGLTFARDAFDFGAVAQGSPVVAEYPFENRGVVPLTLSPPIAGCDCTAEIVGTADLAPGDRGRIRLSCDTARMSGAVRRTATIHSSDAERRSVTLALSGEVLLDVMAEPLRVYAGRVLRGQRLENAFTVRLGSDGIRTTAIRAARTLGPYIGVDWSPGDVVFHVTVAAAAPLGVFTQDVTVITNSKRFPTWTVPITGVVVETLPARRW